MNIEPYSDEVSHLSPVLLQHLLRNIRDHLQYVCAPLLCFLRHSWCGQWVPNEKPVKLGKTRKGDDGMRTKRDGAIVFTRLGEFVSEFEDDNDVLLEADYKGFCLE